MKIFPRLESLWLAIRRHSIDPARACAKASASNDECRANWKSRRASPKAPANMQFLKTLAWVLVAVLVAIVASNNWRDVTIDLWSNLQADIKIPVLLLAVFLLGFLPTWLVMRGKLWRLERRVAVDVPAIPAPPPRQFEGDS